MKQLIFLSFALGKTVGFASTPKPAPKTCGVCQLYYDLETGMKEGVTFKQDSEALYAVLDVNPLWPFDRPVVSERWGCSCEREGFSPMWLSPNGLCFWYDQQKNQAELLSNDNITEAHRRSCQGAEAGGIKAEEKGAPRSPPSCHSAPDDTIELILTPCLFPNLPPSLRSYRCILLPHEALRWP